MEPYNVFVAIIGIQSDGGLKLGQFGDLVIEGPITYQLVMARHV
jgi:hypothetical protein